MSERPGQQVDLTSDAASPSPAPSRAGGRKYLGIHFACCGVYSRIYLNPNGDAYQGECPRCRGKLRVPVGAGGVNSRFFTAY